MNVENYSLYLPSERNLKDLELPASLKRRAPRIWKLAYADNELDVMEEHRIRRIAELINVDHSDFIRLKIQARDQ